jgi:ribonuclease HI
MTALLIPHTLETAGEPEYLRWAQTAPHTITHIATITGGNVTQPSEVLWIRGTQPPQKHIKVTHVIIVWNSTARRNLGWTPAHADALIASLRDACGKDAQVTQGSGGQAVNIDPNTAIHPAWAISKMFREAAQEPAHHMSPDAPHDRVTTYHLPPCKESNAQPLHAWDQVTYCDASRMAASPTSSASPKEYRLGASVWRHNGLGSETTLVDPGHACAGDTINHAELCALHAAISMAGTQHTTITSDCSSALAQVRKAVLHPALVKFHRHAELLHRIVELLKTRIEAGHPPISILKVRAHSGCIGNEMADIAAKIAAKHGKYDITMPGIDRFARDNIFWLHSRRTPRCERPEPQEASDTLRNQKRRNTGTSADGLDGTTSDAQGESSHLHALNNMQDALRKHMHSLYHLGGSNTESVYYCLWRELQEHAEGELSNAFLTHPQLPQGARRTALATRMGVLWSAKRAKMMGLSQTGACPLCGQHDGGSHIASGCQHETMKRMYTARHNAAGRQLLSCINKGSMGSQIYAADVGREELCLQDGTPHLHFNHVTQDLIPPPPGASTKERKAHTTMLNRLRPDILLVERNGARSHIRLVEFKTCIDTRRSDQLEAARTQHAELTKLLLQAGHTVETIPILVGVTGTIFKETTLGALERLGATHTQAQACCRKLHLLMITHLHGIVCTRRRLEPANDRPRPPRPRQPG